MSPGGFYTFIRGVWIWIPLHSFAFPYQEKLIENFCMFFSYISFELNYAEKGNVF